MKVSRNELLLADADVPYDLLREMDDIQPELPRAGVTLVIGANDDHQPGGQERAGQPHLRHADSRRR